jgi:hypothetical protein
MKQASASADDGDRSTYLRATEGGVMSREADHLALRSETTGAKAVGAMAIGAIAIGALSLGALAIGALAIGGLAIGRARIRCVEIDELVVRRLRVTEDVQLPDRPRWRSEDE